MAPLLHRAAITINGNVLPLHRVQKKSRPDTLTVDSSTIILYIVDSIHDTTHKLMFQTAKNVYFRQVIFLIALQTCRLIIP